MAHATAELMLAEVATLPAEEREKLRTLRNRQPSAAPHQATPNDFIPPFATRDPAASRRWLAAHRAECAGQYVALDGDRLVAHVATCDARRSSEVEDRAGHLQHAQQSGL